ncbi:hypothetical protein BH11MYX2_BH11MYX2_21400 [soil metagenome]
MRLRAEIAVLLALASGCGRFGFDDPASGDGGPQESGAADSFADLCARSSVILCEDFEGNLDTWTARGRNALPASATTTRPYEGMHSLESVVGAPNDESYFTLESPEVDAAVDLYVRMWVYLPKDEKVGHVNLLTLQSQGPGFSLVAIDDDFNVFSDTSMQFTVATAPRDTWFCAELELHKDATAGILKGTIGAGTSAEATNQSQPMMGAIDTNVSGLTTVDLGTAYTGPTQDAPLHTYIDNVLIKSGAPVGCYP